MYKDRVVIPLVFGLILYGFHLVCVYQTSGQLDLISDVMMPIVIGVPLWILVISKWDF
jgi:hypothetical protein